MARAHRGRRVGRQSPGRRFSPRAVRRYGRHAPLPSAGRRATTARPCGHSRHHDQDAGRTYRYTPATTGIDRRPTTLLDPAAAPATELAALYHERWEVETAYDEVKTHILGPGALLRSKTPDLDRCVDEAAWVRVTRTHAGVVSREGNDRGQNVRDTVAAADDAGDYRRGPVAPVERPGGGEECFGRR